MTVIDIVILVVIFLSCMMGGFRGLVKESLSLAAWVTAFLLSAMFYESLSIKMAGLIDNPGLRDVVAFALLFILTIFVGTLISNLVSKAINRIGLGGTDRLLGALFGIIRGLIIVALVILLVSFFDIDQGWFAGSALVPYIVVLIEQLQDMLGNTVSALR